ncbi:ran-binding protein 3-like [Hyperolius riggenbachi]|uniref:ran-binding protein 3-like n=1 Tax=Hyperolius riggenbachi TaxID=752182 RepID=UPI0035A36CF4
MRNQQPPILIRENVFFPEIEPLSSHSLQPSGRKASGEASTAAATTTMCITHTGRRPATSPQLHARVEESASNRSLLPACPGDNSLLSQHAFLLDKKDRPFKRHAIDLVLRAEYGLCVHPEKRLRSSSFTFRPSQSSEAGPSASERRVRSSSFSLLTAFPPNQPGLKKNVFMPSSLLQDQTPSSGTDTEEKLHSWTVIKPATLQPPQVTQATNIEDKQSEAKNELALEGKASSVVNNVEQPKSSHGSACTLGMEIRMQPFSQMPALLKNTSDFVFGENMEKRVMSPRRPNPFQTSVPPSKRESASARLSCNRNWPYSKHRLPTSLIESAAEYSCRPKLKYELDQVKIYTGEESERNVLQVNCKLFVFNKEQQAWTERGRGYLKLNDTAACKNGLFQSRLVMRNHGNLKLILNSRIFREMKLEKANRKCLRITATDLDSSVKIFLVQASVKDAGRLYAAIHHRLIALMNYRAQQVRSAPDTDEESDSPSQLHSSDSEDEDEKMIYPNRMSGHQQWIRRRPALYS